MLLTIPNTSGIVVASGHPETFDRHGVCPIIDFLSIQDVCDALARLSGAAEEPHILKEA